MSNSLTTKKYTVQEMDTLEGIAARNDSTIGQMMKLNRLSTRVIFPGQILLIPIVVDPVGDEFDGVRSPTTSSPVVEQAGNKRFPGHIEAVSSFSTIASPPSTSSKGADESAPQSPPLSHADDADEYMRKFLKIFVREFTQTEGVVSGVLLVTPNCIMFDPDVSHPLVIENGSEKYAMVAPMEMILSVALYKKISALTEASRLPEEVYRTPEEEEKPIVPADSSESVVIHSNGSREDEVDANSGVAIDSLHDDDNQLRSEEFSNFRFGEIDTVFESTKNVDEEAPLSPIAAHLMKPKVFKTLSQGMSCINRASGSILHRAQSVGGSGAAMAARLVTGVPKKFVHMSSSILGNSADQAARPPAASVPGLHCAPDQQKPYATLSELMRKTAEARQNLNRSDQLNKIKRSAAFVLPTVDELVPHVKSPGACTQLPYFLHVVLDSRLASARSPDDQVAKDQFWFSMPKEMAQPFYEFMLRLCPEKYGVEVDQSASADEQRKMSSFDERSFIVLDQADAKAFKRPSNTNTKSSSFVSSSCTLSQEWEIVSLSEIKRRLSLKDIADVAHHPLPAGCEESNLLDEHLIRKLIDVLPARAQGYPWLLVYSSDIHGFALSTMYRCMGSLKEDFVSPSLLVVRDTNGHTFGCVVSCRFHLSEHYYGTGESLLFTTHPTFQTFRWTGQNTYIVKGSLDSLAFGAGSGVNGLWLDSDFYRGRTERCDTFANDPLTDGNEFLIAGIEAWCFRLD